MSLTVLIIGSGGREHALAWKLEQSPLVEKIYVVPGNGGTASLGSKVSNVTTISGAFPELLAFAVKTEVNLVVPGPEVPLVEGIVDYFKQHGPASISVFGPSKAAAHMEGSKAFSKDFMQRNRIPTAEYGTFTSYDEAKTYLDRNKSMKVVLKASGLAAGKGVLIPGSYEEAVKGLQSIMLDREFGEAGDEVVIEEFLEGEELSILSFSDGFTIRTLPASQDHKRVFDNDEGPNTGGMGTYAPTAVATPALMEQVQFEILQPTIDAMRNERTPFVGCLFTGLMITNGKPRVLEYNVRFGDPETQSVLPLLDTDLAEIMLACTSGYLSSIELKLKPCYCTTVVVAAGGYPGKYDKNEVITLEKPQDDTYIFHAGTSLDPKTSTLTTTGGRVIASTAIGSSILEAVERAYSGVSTIKFNRMHYRKDIAHRALNRPSPPTPDVSQPPSPLTYASAGVSITSGNDLVSQIKPLVRKTARPGCDADIGGFGGEISLSAAGFTSPPTVLAAIDGIGTKIMVAIAVDDVSTCGIDLVAMNTNDLVVAGCVPLAFLDYYACGRLDVTKATSFVAGVVEGCIRSNCALIGGETAEMPKLYKDGDFDGAGCAIGALAAGKQMLPLKDAMRAGDVVLGLASSGCHSNGFSLIRRIVERAGLSYTDAAPWETTETTGAAGEEGGSSGQPRSVGRSLLEPTRIYVKPLLHVFDASPQPRIKGLAHITGGGLTENIPRCLPKHLSASLDVRTWDVPPVFKWLKKEGRMDGREFARTFNTGLGMVAVVGEGDAEDVQRELEAAGERVWRVGKLVERGSGGEEGEKDEGCVLRGLEAWERF